MKPTCARQAQLLSLLTALFYLQNIIGLLACNTDSSQRVSEVDTPFCKFFAVKGVEKLDVCSFILDGYI